MTRPLVVSFFDYTGHAVRDWARAGFECWCIDNQHPDPEPVERFPSGGLIRFRNFDLSSGSAAWSAFAFEAALRGDPPAFVFSFTPCTDLATSGALHWNRKRAADPLFQDKAVAMARLGADFADRLGSPYMIENPRSALATRWRSPDYKFHPYEFGGYLPEDDRHPRWPDYIAPRDAYPKETWLWTGGGFAMPEPRPVEPEVFEVVRKRGPKAGRVTRGARQWLKLGGSSLRTKNIRNETPRGFARAVFLANCPLAIREVAA